MASGVPPRLVPAGGVAGGAGGAGGGPGGAIPSDGGADVVLHTVSLQGGHPGGGHVLSATAGGGVQIDIDLNNCPYLLVNSSLIFFRLFNRTLI